MFRIGSQCGLKPNEVLDMQLDMFNAYVKGYSDRLLDQQILAMQTGHWAAYFVGSRHPKSPKELAKNMQQGHEKQDAKNRRNPSTPRPEVDVEGFLEQEAKFKAKLKQQGR